MDDQRRRPDPTSRPDPYELAVARAASSEDGGPGAEDGSGTPPLPRLQLGPFRVGPVGLLVGVLLLVGAGTLVRNGGDRTPELATSCSEHALALSAQRVRPGGLVEYAATGPGERLALEVATAGPGGRLVQALPPVRLRGCAATGRFGLQADPGEHVVRLRRDGVVVAEQEITVTDRRDPLVG